VTSITGGEKRLTPVFFHIGVEKEVKYFEHPARVAGCFFYCTPLVWPLIEFAAFGKFLRTTLAKPKTLPLKQF
jgi:hypothetical protein